MGTTEIRRAATAYVVVAMPGQAIYLRGAKRSLLCVIGERIVAGASWKVKSICEGKRVRPSHGNDCHQQMQQGQCS